jgi:biopolymer transport protein ExbD
MKRFLILLLIVAGCGQKKDSKEFDTSKQDAQLIEKEIADFYSGLRKAYNHQNVNTDSLIDAHFDADVYYVTYWGNTEPIDTTKKRLKAALSHVTEYENHYEGLRVKVYGDGAYSFVILRQDYKVDGRPLEEYLPTTYVFERRGDRWIIVHAQRTSDYQTMQELMDMARAKPTTSSADAKH